MNKSKENILQILAEHIGTDPDEINDTDSLSDDLHMSAVDIVDFLHKLEEAEYEVGKIDISAINTVEEIVDKLIDQHYE